jgi:hypothetical protein
MPVVAARSGDSMVINFSALASCTDEKGTLSSEFGRRRQQLHQGSRAACVPVGDVFALKLMKQCPEEGLINAKETSGKQSSDCC